MQQQNTFEVDGKGLAVREMRAKNFLRWNQRVTRKFSKENSNSKIENPRFVRLSHLEHFGQVVKLGVS